MSTTLHVYTTPPQKEHKALEDCHRARIKVALPRAKLRKAAFGRTSRPVAVGYIFAESRPPETPFMRVRPDGKPLGNVTKGEVANLWKHARIRIYEPKTASFKVGDHIRVKVGPFAEMTGKLAKKRGRRDWTVEMATKSIGTITVKTDHMVRIDPG